MERHPHQHTESHLSEERSGVMPDINTDKLIAVFRRYLPWIIIIMLVANTLAYLKIRYTKPVYESYSDLKLDVKSDASLLGFNNNSFEESFPSNNLAGEIEIIKSRLFFDKIIDVLKLETSYYNYGSFLNEERYKTTPFKATYIIKNKDFYNRNIDIDLINDKEFKLSYNYGEVSETKVHQYGELISNKYFDLEIELVKKLEPEHLTLQYFFRVNSRDALISYLENNLIVEPINYNANIIRISFKDYNISKAVDLVNAIDTLYLKYTQEEKSKVTSQKIEFLNEQLGLTAAKLEEFENYFEDFTIKNKTVDLSADLKKALMIMEQIDSARLNLTLRSVQIKELETLIEKEELEYLSAYHIQFLSKELIVTLQEYNELLRKKSLSSGSYSNNTFVYKKLSAEINLLKNDISKSLSIIKDQIKAKQQDLQKRKQELEINFAGIPSKGTDYNKNKRYYSLYEQFYLTMMQKKAEFEIAQAGISTDFKILSSASYNPNPITPKRGLTLTSGFLIGLVLSIAIVLAGYLMHDKISSQAELESLTSAPILGVVPFTKIKHDEGRLVVSTNPKSSVSESLRTIRTNLDFMLIKEGCKVFSVTSTISGEGKTFISTNLGAILNFSNSKVVIVDLDMRKPKVHRAFNQTQSGLGLSTILIGRHTWQDCVNQAEQDGLHFIQSGPTPPNPSELLLTANFSKLISELKKEYDYIILDTPPIGLVTDGLIAMKAADLQIYIVRADYSRRVFMNTLNKLRKTNQFTNLAVIINSLKGNRSGGYGYGYGYGSGYYEDQNNGTQAKEIFKSLFRK